MRHTPIPSEQFLGLLKLSMCYDINSARIFCFFFCNCFGWKLLEIRMELFLPYIHKHITTNFNLMKYLCNNKQCLIFTCFTHDNTLLKLNYYLLICFDYMEIILREQVITFWLLCLQSKCVTC